MSEASARVSMSFHGTMDFLSVTSSFGTCHMMRSALVQIGKMQAAQCVFAALPGEVVEVDADGRENQK